MLKQGSYICPQIVIVVCYPKYRSLTHMDQYMESMYIMYLLNNNNSNVSGTYVIGITN